MPSVSVPSRLDGPIRRFFDPDQSRGRRNIRFLLVIMVGALTALTVAVGVDAWPVSVLVVPLVAAGLLLTPTGVALVAGAVVVGSVVEAVTEGFHAIRLVNLVVLAVIAVIARALAIDRERLGLSVGRGEGMLLELRDALNRQGDPPPLPAPWHAEVARRAAGGAGFSGDFLVTAVHSESRIFEAAIVDVSGKGVDAGNRSLLLSGAFGALLGAVSPDRFLEAANAYACRREWPEGFATAIHLSLDLHTGAFRIGHAGHPPPAHFSGGSGRWSLLEAEGTVLGVLPSPPFGETTGVLRPHDALLLYTDGMIEVPGTDLEDGIDRLLGNVERVVTRAGYAGGAELLIETAAAGVNDDRALMLVWRNP